MLSVTILTKNSERHLRDVLESLKDFEEVVILDTGSTDGTLAIANNFKNARIFSGEFKGFGPLHNMAADLGKNDWILSLDSDEIMSEGLAKEIFSTEFKDGCVYSFNFRNYFNGRLIKCCGWYPERHVRIYNKKITGFSDDFVHEKILQKDLKETRLEGYISHYSYSSLKDFISKMQKYSDLYAQNYAGKKKASPVKAILHAVFSFLKSYIFKRGVFYGYEGFVISIFNANVTLYKYLKLYEANRKQ